MTAEQIAVNVVHAAKLAEVEPRGYIMARMYETLANIETEEADTAREFADLAVMAQAVPLVWGLEDADEPAEEEIAAAAGEVIAADIVERLDFSDRAQDLMQEAGAKDMKDYTAQQSGWDVFRQKIGMK